jgi:hypothetical protein
MTDWANRTRLCFVYNADSGLFNTMADIGHKIFSPHTYACQLCALTHGYFQERAEWREFVEALEAECEFLHRDEFRQRYPGIDAELPAVFRLDDARPEVCLGADELRGLGDLNALKTAIESRCVR